MESMDFEDDPTIIHNIARILDRDSEACNIKNEILGSLGIPRSRVGELEQAGRVRAYRAYHFFVSILREFSNEGGTLTRLQRELEELRLIRAVDAIKSYIANPSSVDNDPGVCSKDLSPRDLFTGRVRELDEVHNRLTSHDPESLFEEQQLIVTGLGGIGKSELCRAYARYKFDFYEGNTVWMNAETTGTFILSLKELFIEINNRSENVIVYGSENVSIKKKMERVYRRFSGKWLLILDNVDPDIYKYLPDALWPGANKPHVLMTSRNRIWPKVKEYPLGQLDVEDTKDFIRRALAKKIVDSSQIPESTVQIGDSTEIPEPELTALCDLLKGLPLALRQAVAYIEHALPLQSPVQDRIKEYTKLFAQNRSSIFRFFNNSQNDIVLTTWRITQKHIESRGKEGQFAIQILNVISFFEPDNISTELLYFFPIVRGKECCCLGRKYQFNATQEEVNGALSLLHNLSVVQSEPGKLSIHQVVQKAIQLRSANEVTDTWVGANAIYFTMMKEGMSFTKSNLPHALSVWKHRSKGCKLIPHLKTLFTNLRPLNALFYGVLWIMFRLMAHVRPQPSPRAVWLTTVTFAWSIIVFFGLSTFLSLAFSLYMIGAEIPDSPFGNAIISSIIIWRFNVLLLPRPFNSIPWEINELSFLSIKRLSKAKRELFFSVLGSTHNETETLVTRIGDRSSKQYKQDGDCLESIEVLQIVCTNLSRYFPTNNFLLVHIKEILVTKLNYAGEFKQALEILDGLLELEMRGDVENATSEQQKQKVTLLHNRSVLLTNIGEDLTEAAKLAQEVYEQKITLYGNHHPSTLRSRILQAEIWEAEANFSAALEIYREVIGCFCSN